MLKSKVVENYQYSSAQMREGLKLFRTIISVHYLSIYRAVSDLCERKKKPCHVETGRPVLARQVDPLFVPTSSLMQTPTPSIEDSEQEDLLQQYQERVERLSANIIRCLWCVTLLMDLHDFVIEPFIPEHIFRDARTA